MRVGLHLLTALERSGTLGPLELVGKFRGSRLPRKGLVSKALLRNLKVAIYDCYGQSRDSRRIFAFCALNDVFEPAKPHPRLAAACDRDLVQLWPENCTEHVHPIRVSCPKVVTT